MKTRLQRNARSSSSKIAKQTVLERMLSSKNKRLFQKLNGDHSATVDGHAWLFQFVDIIYVGTISNISVMIEECEGDQFHGGLFLMTLSYLIIMFYTRSAYDTYICVSGAGGVIHIAVFCLYAAAVFVMSTNIIAIRSTEEHHRYSNHNFGHCTNDHDYNAAFGYAFISSRVVLIVMYVLYLNIFHESNVTGTISGVRPSTVTEEDMDIAKQSAKRKSSDPNFQGNDRLSVRSANSAVESVMESSVAEHFFSIYMCKIFPMIVSSCTMVIMLSGQSATTIFPIVAAIEILGDFLPTIMSTKTWAELVAHRRFAEDRLGLFFMLVLGEAILGFHSVRSHATKTFSVMLLSYFTLFSLGTLFFEPLQSYTKAEGAHPLEVRFLNALYTTLVCLTCYFMLVSSTGMVYLYRNLPENSPVHNATESVETTHSATAFVETAHEDATGSAESELSNPHHRNLHARAKVVLGISFVMIMITILRIFDKVYYREKLLPASWFKWLNAFYEAAAEHSTHKPTVAIAVDESQLPVGVRRIRPLTVLRGVICCALVGLIWEFGPYHFFWSVMVMVVSPTAIEVCVELLYDLQVHRDGMAETNIIVTKAPAPIDTDANL